MANIEQFFGLLAFIEGTPAAIIVMVTAVSLLIIRSWRGSLSVLIIQYIIAGLLFAEVLAPRMAGLKLVTSLFVCLILYFTGRQVAWGEHSVNLNKGASQTVALGPFTVSKDKLIRAALALAAGAAALVFVPRPEEADLLNRLALAAYGLVVLGLLGVGVFERPFKVGISLLTFLTGYDLLFSALVFSDSLLLFFVLFQLAAALVITYLSYRRYLASRL